MVEELGRVYLEKVEGAKKVYKRVEGKRKAYYLVAQDKESLKLLSELLSVVAYLDENELKMAYYVEGNYVYYFSLHEDHYLVEREEFKEESEVLELVLHRFHGYAPPKVEEDLKELKKRYQDRLQTYAILGLIGSLVLLGVLIKLALTPPAPPQPPSQAQNQPPPPLSPEEVYKTGILFFQDLVSQVNEIISSVKDEKIGEIRYQDSGATSGDKKDYVISWTLYYSYPAQNTVLEEVEGRRFWKREESKTFTYSRNDVSKVQTLSGSYECFEVVLRSYPQNTVVLSRTNGEVEVEVKGLRPSQAVAFLNRLKGCAIYPTSLRISGESEFRFKIREQ